MSQDSHIDAETPIVAHLRELRKCLTKSLLALVITFSLSLAYAKEIFDWLCRPMQRVLPQQSFFIATHPVEAWLTYFKTALMAGFFAASPVLFYQLWRFISPGLYKSEQKLSLLFVFFSSLLFTGGAFFGYEVVFPIGFEYFVGVIQDTEIQFLPRMEDYLAFVFKMLLAFGISFELPLFIYFLGLMGLVSLAGLKAFRKYWIVLALTLAAILTPPDVVSQILLAIPLLMLYEVGVAAVFLKEKLGLKTASPSQRGS